MVGSFRLVLVVLSALAAFGFARDGAANAAGVTSLYSFCTNFQAPSCLDGETPSSQLLRVGEEFYGTTTLGGLSKYQYTSGSKTAYGTLFRVSTSSTFTTLYEFCKETYCTDGATPGVYLTLGPKREVYGVTVGGGKAEGGTIFRFVSQAKLATLYRFCSQANCTDGMQPVSVVFNADGVLFGTASAGGSHGSGVAFTINSSGFHVLHSFCSLADCADGITPGALVIDKNGDFYGTTAAGGTHQGGTVFRMTPTGALTTLYSLCATKACADGAQPNTTLTRGADGNFYGTAALGGANNYGTVFRITPAGALDVLHSFCGSSFCYDGSSPMGGLALASDGSLYGTTTGGGRYYHGVLFHITTAGGYSVAHQFCAERGCFDGSTPSASPALAGDGNFYGTTSAGGDQNNSGTIYRFTP